MSGIAAALGAAGPGKSFPALGQEWRLGFITKAMQAEYEQWLERRALGMVLRQKGAVDPDAFADLLASIGDAAAAGRYGWARGKAWFESIKGYDGLTRLLWLALRANHPDITEEQALAVLKAEPELVGKLLLTSILGTDPNAQAPAAQPTQETAPGTTK